MKRWDLNVGHKLENGKYISTRVGIVFENDRGNLSIKLDPGIAIHSAPGVTINGFTQRPREPWGQGRGAPQQQQELPKSDADDSEWV